VSRSSPDRASAVAFWTALCVALLAVISLATAITTPPRSGPFCRSDCVSYPYTDASRFVPRDYLWMYPATLLLAMFVVLVGLLHERCAPDRRWLAGVALCFTGLGVTPLALAYGIQLTVMQPSLLSGRTEGLSPWSQYNPSGLFIALENIGYTTLGLAFIFVGLALPTGVSRILRVTGMIFTLGGALILALLLLLAAIYRSDLAYRFEVWSILVTWLVMAITAVTLSVAFSRDRAAGSGR
jgi:hypothetical protein